MDGNQFDVLAKELAHARSRRGVLKGLGAAALGAIGLNRLGDAAAAKPACREQGHPCEGNQTCCDQLVCVVSGPGAARRCTPCPSGTVFVDGSCCTPATTCPAGQNCGAAPDGCGGTLNCGACPAGQTCDANGVCQHTPVCTPAPTCQSNADCGPDQTCQHGGCFTTCNPSVGCSQACTACSCDPSINNLPPACRDYNFGVGPCHHDSDCPAGSVCDPFIVNRDGTANLCTRPCPSLK